MPNFNVPCSEVTLAVVITGGFIILFSNKNKCHIKFETTLNKGSEHAFDMIRAFL